MLFSARKQQVSFLCTSNAIFSEEQTMWQAPSHPETAYMTNLRLCLKPWKPCYNSPLPNTDIYICSEPFLHPSSQLLLLFIWSSLLHDLGQKLALGFLVESHQKEMRGEFSEQEGSIVSAAWQEPFNKVQCTHTHYFTFKSKVVCI